VIPTPVIPRPGPAHARGKLRFPSKPRSGRGAEGRAGPQADGVAFAPSKPKTPTLRGPRGYAVRTPDEARQAALDTAVDLVQRTATRVRVWARYRTGKPTAADRHAVLERLSLDARHALAPLADRLLDGSLARTAWEVRVRDVIAPRLYAGMLAGTGRREFTPTLRKWADSEVDRQLAYLKRFRTEIGTADQPFNGTIRTRSDLYGGAVWAAGQNVQIVQAIDDGFTERKAVLGRADHCRTRGGRMGCVERAALGWHRIDDTDVPIIGGTPCGSRCHCRLTFR
jgi:hypothetical protein